MLGALLLSPTSLALAEAGARQDHSQLLVWAFLGMCALIVIIQLMPVVMIAFGLIRGLVKDKAPQPQAQAATDE
ncbi:MAG: hypothetical protein FDZ69_01705 [Deltaproteobacteria bacterium]|nr:MAG: hypothetical protein FDZ69_01705 [Deltaproteobacteria bacterium]